ncbi:hypothetical protein MtrunA17_Chr4g0069191 [Medicago truncatula]|uniref:Uncharacterized protein n=1 Tax=Medicago truncatula TaxID=3880 RepID=A0A396IKR1_MEDTR|nr:hypothetical protein MtrunA17_Chr4g0069191 [Medicago truncatula]
MCLDSPQIMYYFILSRLQRWFSICKIYLAECESFTRHESQCCYSVLFKRLWEALAT